MKTRRMVFAAALALVAVAPGSAAAAPPADSGHRFHKAV